MSMSNANLRSTRRGFSLIELLIVVSLMGILAALALPALSPNKHEELQATAQIICGDLAYARSLAVSNNSSYRVEFQSAANRYVLQHSGSNAALDTLPEAPFRSPSDPIDQQIVDLADLPHLAGHNVRLAGVTAGGARVTPADIEFGPSGETSRAVESVVWLVAGAGDDVRYLPIHVSPVTGLATMGAYSPSGPSSPSMAATASGP